MAEEPERLRHADEASYLRSLHMFQEDIFVFVEGTNTDTFFYESICDAALGGTGVAFGVRPAKEIPSGSGGKDRLLSFHRYIARRGELVSEFAGNRIAVLFFADKDVDDILGRLLQAPHFVYTEYYDVENYVFVHGDVVRGATSAAPSVAEALGEMGESDRWHAEAASKWQDWVVVCLFVSRHPLPGCPSYGSPSQINLKTDGTVDAAALEWMRAHLRSAWGASRPGFDAAYERTAAEVAECYSRGDHGRVFKGKWYVRLLADDVSRATGDDGYRSESFHEALLAAVQDTVDYRGEWSERFTEPLRAAATDLGKLRPGPATQPGGNPPLADGQECPD